MAGDRSRLPAIQKFRYAVHYIIGRNKNSVWEVVKLFYLNVIEKSDDITGETL